MRFKVRAANDAHIALTTGAVASDPMYEIFIGGWGNQKSCIRKNRSKPDVAEVPTPNILNGGEFRTFWVRWDNGTISCGCESNPQPFISWTDNERVAIYYVGVCTGWGATGAWIIHQGAPLPGYGGGQQFGGQPQPGQFGGSAGFGSPQQFGQQPGQFGGPQPQQFGGAFGGAQQQPGQFGGSGGGYGAPQPQSFGGPQAQAFGAPSAPGNFGQAPGGFGGASFGQQPGGFGAPGGGYGGGNQWVASSGGNIPPRAFVGGEDKGEPLYVIRCNFQGAVIPGKLVPSHRTAYVPWGGVENGMPQYEVLCDCSGRWVSCSGGNIPPNAISGGRSENGEPLYVGRVQHQGTITVGKVQRSHNCCYIPFGGQEISFQQYEILTS